MGVSTDRAETDWCDGQETLELGDPVIPGCDLCNSTGVCVACGGRVTNGWDQFEALRPIVRDAVDAIRRGGLTVVQREAELARHADLLDRATAGF